MSLIIDPNLPEEELRKALENYCDSFGCGECSGCVFENNKEAWCEHYGYYSAPIKIVTEAIKEINKSNEDNSDANNEVTNEVTEPQYDIVSHPKHYCREDAIECIEEMIILYGKEVVKHFCLCNIHKYRYRASAKNGDEDIRKSDFYVKKYKELCEDEVVPKMWRSEVN